MIGRIKEMMKDELVRGSMVLVISIVIFNLFNYAFQISMAKMLGPADFGVLAALMSIIYILNIPGEAIQTVVSKYTSKFVSQNKIGKIKELMIRSGKKGFKFAVISFVILCILSILLSEIIKIELWLLILTGVFAFYIFLVPIGRGILQGQKRFLGFGLNLIFESCIKVLVSILLVFAGWRVYGAIAGVLISSACAFFIIFAMLKKVVKSEREQESFDGLYKGSMPVLAAITAIVLMYSIDILIAKAVFDPEVAGQYAFISLIGKVIIFVSSSIGRAMLPLSSEKHEKGIDTQRLFQKSLLLVTAISVVILLFYYALPEFIVYLVSLGSDKYVEASHILFRLGAAYAMLSIANIIILYKISVNKIRKSAFVLIIFAVIQALLLIYYKQSLDSFANAFLVSNILLFVYSLFVSFKK